MLTGGTVITEDLGISLDSVQLNDLGQTKRAVIDKDNTTIVEGAGKKADIKGRVEQIRRQIEETTSTTIEKRTSGQIQLEASQSSPLALLQKQK